MRADENPATADPHASVYDGLLGQNEGHWAFGTSFDDPLAGVDVTVADDVDHKALAAYCLMLGDDALIMSQQLARWTAKAPDLEEDVALSNTALDLLGQARLLLARCAGADSNTVPEMPTGSPVPAEDALAYFRAENEFRNVGLVEADNGDFASTLARLLIFTTWRLAIFDRLASSADTVLAAVAAKGIKEMTYHRDYAARWVVTLAQGTEESRRRTIDAWRTFWPCVDELFQTHEIERIVAAQGVGVDPSTVRADFDEVLGQVFDAAELDVEQFVDHGSQNVPPSGGRSGNHGEEFAELLDEFQSVARAHPMGSW